MTLGNLGHSEEHRRLERALEIAGLGEFEWDITAGLFMVSRRMSAITGLPAGPMPAVTTEAIEPFIHPDDLENFRARRQFQRDADGAYEFEFRHIRPNDGRAVWVRVAGVIKRGADGKGQSVTGIVEDITEIKVEELQRQALMAELDHRVKNVLATVQSLAIQTARRTTSLEAFLSNFGGRLKALSSANELLTAARWRGAAIDHLAAAELGAIAPGQTNWDGPELFLTPRAANALALGLHELAANAVKFGALSAETGRVDLRWARSADGGFELTWTETGGPTVTRPTRLGFGSTLLEQVTGRELNGEASIDYRPSGVVVRLHAGAAAIAPRPASVPDVQAPRPPEAVATSGPTNLRGARVLIVEDAVLLAMELETGLSDAGATIIGPAYELEEAMALLDQPIDAAVLDANLNGHSVTPVAEVLSARKIPFVFATGYGDQAGAPGSFDAPVIRKPYDVTQVAVAVAELLKANTSHP